MTRALLALLASVLLVAGCGDDGPADADEDPVGEPAPTAEPPTEQVRGDAAWTVVDGFRGGLCPEGACAGEVVITADGTVLRTIAGETVESRELDAATLEELDAAVRATTRDDLVIGPFTGTCPTAYDGQERLISIRREGSPTIDLAGCTDELDPDAALLELLTAISAG